jgi:WD40 repeat protein/tRNA A-37 threonylcarbamoyl transferase component Bud32
MHVRCPHCHQPIDLVQEDLTAEMICSSCGNSFSLVSGESETVNYTQHQTLGQFELIERVGMGKFGSVWKARDTQLDRLVAVKVPRKDQLSSAEAEMFFREARTAAQLKHPNIVGVHEVGREGESIFIVSDFVPGANLHEWLSAQRLTPREAAELCAKIADAVAHAHAAGVVHRDLKPGNIMLDADGHPHITDFGLAKREAGEITMTLDGAILGTPAYMSPEQARGEAHQADARSDVYSLGVILFELLTGELPFRGETRMLVVQILHDEPPSPRKLNARIPRDLETICLKCLEKDPKRRYASARPLAEEFERYLAGKPILARPIGPIERAWRWSRQKPLAAGLLAALLLLVVVLSAATWLISSAYQREAALATANEKLAFKETNARKQADTARARSEFLAVRQTFELGWSKYQEGNVLHALALMAHSLVALESPSLSTALVSPSQRREIKSLAEGIRNHLIEVSLASYCPRATFVHSSRIHSIAFSPDGTKLATGCNDGTARLWDLTTGKLLGQPLQHQGGITSVAFIPDGMKLATGSLDGAHLWDVATGKTTIGQPIHYKILVNALALSADRTKFATRVEYTKVRFWDVATGKPIGEPLQQQNGATSVAFSPDGTKLATGSWDGLRGTARLWDVATGKPLGEPLKYQGWVNSVAFSPDGTKLATGSRDKTARLWDVATGKPIGEPLQHQGWVSSIAFSPDGTKLATSSEGGTARLWDAATGKPICEPMQHHGYVWTIVFSPDGTKLATGCNDGTARLWDTATGKLIGEPMQHQGYVDSVAFSPDGTKLASGSEDKMVRLWDVSTGNPTGELIQHEGYVNSVAFSPDGTKLATGSWGNSPRLWDVATSKPIGEPMQRRDKVQSVAFSPDGTKLATGEETARLWDTATGKPLGEPLRIDDQVLSVAFSPDGAKLATASRSRDTARLWDVSTCKPIGEPVQVLPEVLSVAFSPDGTKLAMGSQDGTARLWEVSTRKPIGQPMHHENSVMTVAYSRDGTKLATGSLDNTARLWDVATSKLIGQPMQHESWVKSVAFSPDGTKLATGSQDMKVRLWDVATATLIGEPMQHQGYVNSVAFSPDGTKLASGADDGARLWDVPTSPTDSPGRVLVWVETLCGVEVNEDGVVLQLSADRHAQKREQLAQLGGPPKAWLEALARRRAAAERKLKGQ